MKAYTIFSFTSTMSWDVYPSLKKHPFRGRIYAVTDTRILSYDKILTITDRHSKNILKTVENSCFDITAMNENYLVISKHELFDYFWHVEVYDHMNYEIPIHTMVLRRKIYPKQFSLYGHFLGIITLNTIYQVHLTVVNLQNGTTVFESCQRKHDGLENETFLFLHAPPRMEIQDQLIVCSYGSDICSILCKNTGNVLQKIQFPGVVLYLVMKDRRFVVLSASNQNYLLTIFDIDHQTKKTRHLNDLFPCKNFMDMSSTLFVYGNAKGELFFYDFIMSTWYTYNLQCSCSALCIREDSVFVTLQKTSEIIELHLDRIPTRLLYLTVFKHVFGRFDENYDLKHYLLEFIGTPLYRGQVQQRA